jgi:hypothetical protein
MAPCCSVLRWSGMSTLSSYSVLITIVYSHTRIFYNLRLHVAVFKDSKECPPNQPRVSHLPLWTYSQGYTFTNDSMKQWLKLVRNVPQIIQKCLIYLSVLTHNDTFSHNTPCSCIMSWSRRSPKSSKSVSLTFVYSLTRIIHNLGLHVAVFRVGQDCPSNHPWVSHLPLSTHSQGYFIT